MEIINAQIFLFNTCSRWMMHLDKTLQHYHLRAIHESKCHLIVNDLKIIIWWSKVEKAVKKTRREEFLIKRGRVLKIREMKVHYLDTRKINLLIILKKMKKMKKKMLNKKRTSRNKYKSKSMNQIRWNQAVEKKPIIK